MRKQWIVLGTAIVVCAAAACLGYRHSTSPVQITNEALSSLADDYNKVQAMAYTGMVELDWTDSIEVGGTLFFRVNDPELQTMADFKEVLNRVYVPSKAEEILSYCTETTGVLTEKDGVLYRADAYEMGWPLEPKANAAQREGDTITADITLAYNEPTPGILTLQKEAGVWKISDLSM